MTILKSLVGFPQKGECDLGKLLLQEFWFFTFSSGILVKEQTCTGQQQLDYEPRRACN